MARPLSLTEPSDPVHRRSADELLLMTVDIGDGRQDIIRVNDSDDPEALAKAFATKHGLVPSLEQNLVMLIQQNKEIVQMKTVATLPDNFNWNEHASAPIEKDPEALSVHSERQLRPSPTQPKGLSVYERLYKQAKSKANGAPSAIEKAKSAHNLNYGEWLYIKGLKHMQEHKQKNEDRKQESENKAKTEVFTFNPLINEYSKLIAPRYFEKTEELLLRKASNYKDRLEALKAKQLEEEMKECSFAPVTLGKSASPSSNKYEALYLEAEKRRQKRQLMTESANKNSYSFKPNVAASKKPTPESQEEIADRLINYKKESLQKIDRARQEAASSQLVDQGKPLFKPSTGRNPTVQRNPEGEQIHEYLYAKRNDRAKKLTQSTETYQLQWDVAANSQKVNRNSEKIYEQYRAKQYAKLFALMDSDADGDIAANAISLDHLDTRTLEILTPLFKTLDEGVELNLNSFVALMEEIWKNLSVEERMQLLKREPRASEEEDEGPQGVSPRTNVLAEKKRQLMPANMYERLYNSKQLVKLKTDKTRELREEAELKECTFKPKIKKTRKAQ